MRMLYCPFLSALSGSKYYVTRKIKVKRHNAWPRPERGTSVVERTCLEKAPGRRS
jgi:hypothetical protein